LLDPKAGGLLVVTTTAATEADTEPGPESDNEDAQLRVNVNWHPAGSELGKMNRYKLKIPDVRSVFIGATLDTSAKSTVVSLIVHKQTLKLAVETVPCNVSDPVVAIFTLVEVVISTRGL
jgi:hypothetical protein